MRSRWISVALGVLAVVAGAVGVMPAPSVLTAHADSLQTVKYTDTGGCPTAIYTVDPGVGAIDVTVIGEQGGGGQSGSGHGGGDGGRGASVSARLPVTPGETLEIVVAGIPGGLSPGQSGGDGGAGSGIFLSTANCNVGTPLLIAAGGGGGGSGDLGGPGGRGGDAGLDSGSAGNSGASNEQEAGAGGGGGTSTTGGSGGRGGHGTTIIGTGFDGLPGQAFSAIRAGGGAGAGPSGDNASGGGGGGGWFGGGGGGGSGGDGGGGGGGGSSFVESTATDVTSSVAAAGTAPSITITPSLYATATEVISSAIDPASTDSVTYTALVDVQYVTSPAGTVHFVATQGATTVDMGSTTLTSVAGSRGTTSVNYALGAGNWSVTATYSGNGDSTPFGSIGYAGSTSTPVSQTVGTAPQITKQPVDSITDLPAGGASFTAAAKGDSTPTVQWQQSQDNGATWQLVPGGTSPTLTLLCTFCEGRYRAVFTNPLGSVTTLSALAAVNHPPSVGTLGDVSAPAGGSATFAVGATAYPQPTAHWQVSTDHGAHWSDPDPNRTTVVTNKPPRSDQYAWQSSLTFNDVAAADNGTEARVTFSNTFDGAAHSATSNAATLHLTPSCIVANPTPTNFSHCEFANLAGLDLHGIDFSYGDYAHATFLGDTLDGANFTAANLTGAVFGSVSLASTFFDSTNMTDAYLVGDDFSRTRFLFTTVTGTILMPSDTTVYTTGSGATVTWPTPPALGFSAFDCSPESGSTFPLDTAAGGTRVSCTVSDPFIGIGQGTFTVHVLPAVAPQVTLQPVDATVFWQPGGYATPFTAAASGTPAPSIQWQVSSDGGTTFTDIPGATFEELLITNPPFSSTGNQYRAVFSNMAGTVASNPATLHVGPQPITVEATGSQTFGDLLPTFTPVFNRPDGETLLGSLTCTGLFTAGPTDTPITSSLAPGSYVIDPRTCSGLTPSPDSTDYEAEYQPGSFVVSPVTITVDVSGTVTPGAGPLVFTETDDAPSGVLPPATTITCTTVDGGNPIVAKPGSYTLDGRSCTYNPPFSDPDYTVQFTGVTNGFVVSARAVHVTVAGGEQYGGTPSFVDAGDDAAVNGVTLSGTLTCAEPSGPSPLPVGPYTVSGATCSGLSATPAAPIDYLDGGFVVAPAPLSLTADHKSMVYGQPLPSFTYQLAGLVGTDPPAVVSGVTCNAPTAGSTPAVGTYAVVCSGGTATNYGVTGYTGGTLTVTRARATVVAEAKSMTYGGSVPAFTYHVDGLVSPDTADSVVSGVACVSDAATPPVVGTFTVTCNGGSATNYDLSYTPAMLTVGKASLDVAAKDKTMTYGGPVPTFDATVSGLGNDDTFASLGGSCGDAAATVTLAAGTYAGAITCSGVDTTNYDVTYHAGTLTVNREPVSVTAKPKSMTYGGTVPTFDATVSGLVNGDSFGGPGVGGSCSSSSASATLAAGTYPGAITCSGLNTANYDPTYYPGTLTVNQVSLTVTADGKTMTYGDTVPMLTATLSGFVNSQNLATSGVTGQASCTTTPTATSISASGPYTINCALGTLSASNYTFGPFVAGTLSIGKHPATVGYTGGMFFSTGSASATTASVTLQGQVTPGAGGTVDLTTAQVTFLLYKSTNSSMASPDATCVAPSVSATGAATCVVNGLAVDNWTVVPIIPLSNAYFTAPQGDPVILSVYQPTTGLWATGGGWVSDPSSTVSSSNGHGNFGFNVRYTTNNAPKGQSVFAFRGADGYDYVVKSNSWQGGGLSCSTTGAGFNGKASVIVIDPATGLQVSGLGGGNYSFRVDATQNTSTPNTYAISVYSSAGVLWHQAGTTAKQLPLGGGTIMVHSK